MDSDSIFVGDDAFGDDGARFTPTGHARGPWDPGALHGGAPAALITAAFERFSPGAELAIAQLHFEFLRPIPMAPLTLSSDVARPGRRVQGLVAELRTDDGVAVCRASALRVIPAPTELPALPPVAARDQLAPLPAPTSGTRQQATLEGSGGPSFAHSIDMRWCNGSWQLGPAEVWMRMQLPLLEGQPLTPLMRLAGSADFPNGISAVLPFDQFIFINADLTIALWRQPQGEWIGQRARTHLHPGGSGLSESVLYDEHGPVGRATQILVVQPR